MSGLQISTPFPQFFDIRNGAPLSSGYVYFGTQGANPETTPITVYWDSALTLPAAQPLRTVNGYISRNGTPAAVFVNTDSYSCTVRNVRNELVIYSPSVAAASLASVAAATAAAAAAAVSASDAATSAAEAAATAAGIVTSAELDAALAKMRVPVGAVIPLGVGTVPYGYLECNGSAVSRTGYPDLFSYLGTAYGVGDGVTTFNVPDLRGEFIRGWDHGKGTDTGRAIASFQADEFKSHQHNLSVDTTAGIFDYNGAEGSRYKLSGSAQAGSGTLLTGGAETRPRNYAMMYCIKAFDGIVDEAFATVDLTQSIMAACSDEVTALTTGTAKVTFRVPYAFTVSGVRASLTTAQTSGSIFTVDINKDGVSILSTKITIDNGEKTSTTAIAPAVISTSALTDDCEITVDIDQIGDGTAKGLKIALIGVKA